MFVARTARVFACSASFFVACCTSACGASKTIAEEQRVVGQSTLGATTLELVIARSGMDIAFGQGTGRGGFLDAAHQVRQLRVSVRVRDGEVPRPDNWSTYDAYVRERLLAEKLWDTDDDPDAVEVWERAWRGATIERCDGPNDVALRVARGAGVRTRWARARRDESGGVAMRASTDAPDCAALRALPATD